MEVRWGGQQECWTKGPALGLGGLPCASQLALGSLPSLASHCTGMAPYGMASQESSWRTSGSMGMRFGGQLDVLGEGSSI